MTQPRNGYRAGQDPILLAATCQINPGQSLMDLGCGVGTLGLCVQARVAGVEARGLELDLGLSAWPKPTDGAGQGRCAGPKAKGKSSGLTGC